MNLLNLNEHKLTIALAVLTAGAASFLPYFPHVSAGLAASIMGFLGTVNSLVQRYSMPPLGKETPKVTP
jgi:hypothetical protein